MVRKRGKDEQKPSDTPKVEERRPLPVQTEREKKAFYAVLKMARRHTSPIQHPATEEEMRKLKRGQ